MTRRGSLSNLHEDAPQWVFSWQRYGRPAFIRWFPVLWVAVIFAILLTSVRILVTPPKAWKTHTASLIHVIDDDHGAYLKLKAREGGPFPSRFEPSEWVASSIIEKAALESASWTPPVYVPKLRGLTNQSIPTEVKLAAKGVPMMPKRSTVAAVSNISSPSKLSPVIQVLAAASLASMSGAPPPFEGEVDAAIAVEPWRFLIQLDAVGNVGECISLSGGDEVGQSRLIGWLRKISFKPDLKQSTRWIAAEVGFTNQAVNEPVDR